MRFHRVVNLEDLADRKGFAAEIEGRPVVLFREGEAVHALDNLCPHAGARLHQGRVKDGLFVCPMHGARFELETGRCRSPQISEQAIVAHAVRVVDGCVEVCLSDRPMAEPAL